MGMMAQLLLPEFDAEMASTRRFLARVPADKAAWKPHAKSFSLGDLAVHLAQIPTWAAPTLTAPEIDLDPNDRAKPFVSTDELLARFDQHVAEARAAIAAADDAEYEKPWSLKVAGKTFFTRPKGPVLRDFVLSHNVHHRAQLGVYLRLLDVPVPGAYGPTADDR